MKSFIVLGAGALIIAILWATSGFWSYDKSEFLSQKVLDHSIPFSVTINKVVLDSLVPANVTSGTSSKGL